MNWIIVAAAVVTVTTAAVPAAVQGTVRATDGSAIAGARVVVAEAGKPEISATTDDQGRFTLTEVTLPAVIEVSARGFASVRVQVTASPVEITLAPATISESVLVTPTGGPPGPYRDDATGIIGIGRLDFQNIPAVTPDEALKVVSGFSLFRRSSSRASNPTTHGVTMRGLSASGSSRALVLFDAVPLTEGFGGWVTWTRLPPSAISDVEIGRGAAGDSVGTDALGGVIKVAGRTGFGPRAIDVSGEAGSTDTRGFDVSAGRSFGATGASRRDALFAAGSWFASDGTIPVAPEQRGPVDKPSDVNWGNGYGRWTETRGGQLLITVGGWGGSDDRGNGTVLQRNTMSGGTIVGGFDYLSRRAMLTFRQSASPNRFLQTFSTVGAGRATETLTSTQRTTTSPIRTMVEIGRSAPAGQLLFRFASTRSGATFIEEKPTSRTEQDLRDDSDAVSVHGVWRPASSLTIAGGGRHEWRKAPTDSAERDGATVGRFNVAWSAPGRFVVRGSAGSSHRWPTLNELVRNFQAGTVLTVANPDLAPEHAVSADAGVSYDGKSWTASATGFWSVVDGAIANVTLPAGSVPGFTGTARQRRNAGEAHAHGAEIDGEVRLPHWFRVRVSGTIVDAKFRNSQEVPLEGKFLPQVPRISGSLWTDAFLPHAITASLVYHAVSTQFDDDRNTLKLTEAYQLDLQIGSRLRQFAWRLVVENTLDARNEVGRSPPAAAPLITIAPGRVVRFVISYGK